MTDETFSHEMTEAPERICTSQCGKTLVHDGMKRFETDVEYIRADHVADLLKAERRKALREAAVIARKTHDAAMKWAETYVKDFDGKTDSLRIAEEILALISEDATDA